MEELRMIENGYYFNEEGNIEKLKFTPYQLDVFQDWKAIPLSEEWLLKFGFEQREGWDDTEYFFKKGIEIYTDLLGFNYDGFNIKHVHQLQNLYFALTNEDLKIK